MKRAECAALVYYETGTTVLPITGWQLCHDLIYILSY